MDWAREMRRFKRWWQVKGTRHQCPYCHRPLSKFMPAGLDVPVLKRLNVVGGGLRENVKCFVCGSIDRERLIYLYLKRHSSLLEVGGDVLHVSPEAVLMQTLLKNNKVNYVRSNIKASRADLIFDVTQIPLKDDAFDVIIMNHVLEHVDDDIAAMKEVYRVMRQGGFGIFQVPISFELESTLENDDVTTDEQRLATYGQEDHVRLYGLDYISRLESVGFKVKQFDWKTDPKLYPNRHNKYGLIDNEKLFVCSKVSESSL